MSKEIAIIRCMNCYQEISRRVSGELRNPKGPDGCNTRIYTVNESLCPFCNPGKDHE